MMIDGKLVFCPECGTIDLIEGIDLDEGFYFMGCPDCDQWVFAPIEEENMANKFITSKELEDNLNSLRRQWTAND